VILIVLTIGWIGGCYKQISALIMRKVYAHTVRMKGVALKGVLFWILANWISSEVMNDLFEASVFVKRIGDSGTVNLGTNIAFLGLESIEFSVVTFLYGATSFSLLSFSLNLANKAVFLSDDKSSGRVNGTKSPRTS
jgi:hypothetical protein